MTTKIAVTASHLYALLTALNGPGHHIRELQATRNLPPLGKDYVNPIDALIKEYTKQQMFGDFQHRVHIWFEKCFAEPLDTADVRVRCHRFLEEAIEFAQSLDVPAADIMALVCYVYARPVGVPRQELGGTMVTLAALAGAAGLDMALDAETELARVDTPELIERIRAKQASKNAIHDPLPGAA